MFFRKLISTLLPRKVKNITHLILSAAAVIRYGYPAKDLKVIGVTGTDGKTTTSTLIFKILKENGYKAALISTVAAFVGDTEIDTGFHVTAPDAWLLQKLLKKIRDMNYDYVVLEATSHGLDQHRLMGSNIKIGVLTNITHEHLDYHGSFKNYIRAKQKMFKGVRVAILNRADEVYPIFKKNLDPNTKIIAYDLKSPNKKVREAIEKRFPESYNRLNATAAYLASINCGVDDDTAIKAIASFSGVVGRMQEIKNRKGLRIIVDFAHTPNALENVLSALKGQSAEGSRLISVFGCASERDNAKRPLMGNISTRIADISIFTAEDPRREDINKIINEMALGADENVKEYWIKKYDHPIQKEVIHHRTEHLQIEKGKHIYIRIPERGSAINTAIKIAKRGDIVVICGKGHEKSMSYNGKEYPWSDHEAVKLALKGKTFKINHL